jgi:integrase
MLPRLVFTTPWGRPVSPRVLVKHWHAVRVRAGLGRMRFHDLRHTCVSLLLAMKVPPHLVREIAGHSDIKVTMTVYAHGNLDEKAEALNQLGAALLSTTAVNSPAEQGPSDVDSV